MEKIFRICFIAVLLGLFMPVHAQKKKMSPLFNDDFIILTGKSGPELQRHCQYIQGDKVFTVFKIRMLRVSF